MSYNFSACHLCPRDCGADRTSGVGFCGSSDVMHVDKAMLHHFEEPCISGKDKARGSGAIFFSGCPLKCVFCQNSAISRHESGKATTPAELADIMLGMQAQGAYNINFVSPTHYAPLICEAIDIAGNALTVPKVWNTGGYEKPEMIRMLDGYVDVYLTDFKYASPEKSAEYAKAPNYPEYALASLAEMLRLVGKPKYGDDGMMKSGIIVRHLVLPGERKESLKIVELLKSNFSPDDFAVSVMRQYTPDFYTGDAKNLHRRVTSFEYDSVLNAFADAGFDGFSQDADSASTVFTPDFT